MKKITFTIKSTDYTPEELIEIVSLLPEHGWQLTGHVDKDFEPVYLVEI